MKKLFLENGKISVREVPGMGEPGPFEIKVRVMASALSPGSEQALIVSSGINSGSGRQKIKKALDFWKERGLGDLIRKVNDKFQEARPIGYSLAGIVVSCGSGVSGFVPGDRVACAGNQFAHHADEILASSRLCVKIPEGMSFEEASTVTLGAIALNAVRQADVRLGESVGILGMGALGQIAAQLCRAAGARVIGIDKNSRRLAFAKERGWIDDAMEPGLEQIERVERWTAGQGLDAVILALHAPMDHAPIELAARLCALRGRITILGDVAVSLPRALLYEKDLKVNIAVSYGPGRYDAQYEEKGFDYPRAHIRWSAARNMSCYLDLLTNKRIDSGALIQAVYPVEKANEAYEQMALASFQAPILTLLTYGHADGNRSSVNVIDRPKIKMRPTKRVRLGIIGAGGFVSNTHLPIVSRLNDLYEVAALCNRHPEKTLGLTRKFGGRACATADEIFSDKTIDAVLIATRHDTHAALAARAMKAGQAVFMEKPMAVNEDELSALEKVYSEHPVAFHIGFNRRFSPLINELRNELSRLEKPWSFHYRVAAESLPLNHWVYDPAQGARVIGEQCHMVDLIGYLAGFGHQENLAAQPLDVNVRPIPGGRHPTDSVNISLIYPGDILAVIHYQASQPGLIGKERLEIIGANGVIVLEDFKNLRGQIGSQVVNIEHHYAVKGFDEEWRLLARYFQGKNPRGLIDFDEAALTTRLTFLIDQDLRQLRS